MEDKDPNSEPQVEKPPCGIIMPIAAFAGYEAQHWLEVKSISERAIAGAEHFPAPVWERTETDIIQGRIVRNLYEYKIAVCDISGLNPNVMFELGLRLAFKKPVVIVVDDETKIPFDTNVIEHIIYRRSLHFQKTELFIEKVGDRIKTLVSVFDAGAYVAYIDALGAFSTFEPNPQKIEFDQFVLDRLDLISAAVSRLTIQNEASRRAINSFQHIIPNALGGLDSRENSVRVSGWSPEREEILIEMWKAGESAGTIASFLGDVSRNAVIGKAHRLGLRARNPDQVEDGQ